MLTLCRFQNVVSLKASACFSARYSGALIPSAHKNNLYRFSRSGYTCLCNPRRAQVSGLIAHQASVDSLAELMPDSCNSLPLPRHLSSNLALFQFLYEHPDAVLGRPGSRWWNLRQQRSSMNDSGFQHFIVKGRRAHAECVCLGSLETIRLVVISQHMEI